MTLKDSLLDNKEDNTLESLANEALESMEKQGGLFGSALKMAGKVLNPFVKKEIVDEGTQTLGQKALNVGGKALAGGMIAGAAVDSAGKLGEEIKKSVRPIDIPPSGDI